MTLKRSPMKPGKGFKPRATPMARGTSTLKASTPIKSATAPLRARKPAKDKPKRAARNAGPVDYLALCRGQPCYLLAPGVAGHPLDTVVPAHSNQQRHGKAMALKALDVYTVPACMHCHHLIDQSSKLSRAEKFALWDDAYARWEPIRATLIRK